MSGHHRCRQCHFLLITAICLLMPHVFCLDDPTLPTDLFYPFGSDVGDSVVPPLDDAPAGPIPLASAFPLHNASYTKLYVSDNGFISFNSAPDWYTPYRFPLASTPILAVYWADSNTELNKGRVYYREVTQNSSNAGALLTRATEDVRLYVANLPTYEAKWLFIVTWHNVTYGGGSSTTKTNSFQTVMVSDFERSVVFYNYGKLTWTTGDNSGGADGLGGIPAQAGYNSGYSDFYYELPSAMTNHVLTLANTTNVDVTGRWVFPIGEIENALGCFVGGTGRCQLPYQQPHSDTGMCVDVAPAFNCPIFSGPSVIERLWFEFYCAVNTSVTSTTARFEVTFLFNGLPSDDVPPVVATINSKNVTLHEQYLNGKIGQVLSCSISSYWDRTPATQSRPMISKDYFLGIMASSQFFKVEELNFVYQSLVLKSTLPITCPDEASASSQEKCELELSIVTTKDIAVRQRFPGKDPRDKKLRYIFKESDWKEDEKLAYNNDSPLEIVAKVDVFITAPRANRLMFQFPQTSAKFLKDSTYVNPWSNYSPAAVTVYHEDYNMKTCRVFADPHFFSFDSNREVYHNSHSDGTFIYAISDDGDFEVQGHHQLCPGSTTARCVCGVALREEDAAVILNYCDDKPTYVKRQNSIRCKSPQVCFKQETADKLTMQINGPNSLEVTVYYREVYQLYFLNIDVNILGRRNVAGLCGSPDDDPRNDWIDRNTGLILPMNGVNIPLEVSESWRPRNSTYDMFDKNYQPPLTVDYSAAKSVNTYCQTYNGTIVCGGEAISSPIPTRNSTTLSSYVEAQRRWRTQTSNFGGNETKREVTNDVRRKIKLLSAKLAAANITEREAFDTCWQLIVNEKNLGPSCLQSSTQNSDTAEQMVQMCASDVMETGSFEWAYDKVAGIQSGCLYEILTRNNSEINDTQSAIDQVTTDADEILSYTCIPFDCNGNGECVGGSCICDTDYMGSDCAVNKNAVPTIWKMLMPNCDVRSVDCSSVEMTSQDVASLPTLTCRVTVLTSDGVNQTYSTSATQLSPGAIKCDLPPEQLQYNGKAINFSSIHESGFDFSCLYRGIPLVEYTISVSNDGQRFSDEKSQRVFDSVCMNCDDSGCVRKPDTCLINGYCFDNGQHNPYLPACELCDPNVSSTSWTNAIDDTGNDLCTLQQVCPPGFRCEPLPNLNVTCKETPTTTTTTPTTSTTPSPDTACSADSRPLELSGFSGTFTSQNFPNGYKNNSDCQWRILAAESTGIIRLDFTFFFTEPCCDHVKIYDGATIQDPLIVSLAGAYSAAPGNYQSTGKYMFVRFTSDYMYTTRGFSATYTTIAPAINECGSALQLSPSSAPRATGWGLSCYISRTDTAPVSTQCRDLIKNLPGIGGYEELLNRGGNFGCGASTQDDFTDADEVCQDNLQQTITLDSYPSATKLIVCIRLP